MASTKLEVRSVSKSFRRPDGQLLPVVEALSLSVDHLEFVALLGPNGAILHRPSTNPAIREKVVRRLARGG